MGQTPVFISYARNDERYTTELMARLRKEPDIAPWQDRISMSPGDFEDQIKRGIDGSEYLVLVMTPGALRSPWVEKECRYAREQGRCVVPIKPTFDTPAEDANLEARRATLPLWMQRIQTYDFDTYWKRFIAVLQSPCQATRAPDLSARFGTPIVPRPGEFGRLVDAVLDSGRKNPSGRLVVLHGTGGFGKTTLALSVCHDPDVFAACDGGILWATLGEQPAILPELEKIYAALTGERPGFATKDDAMIEVAKKLEGKRCLIVIDDVWRQSDLKPFLHGAATSSRLITTRVFTIAAETTDEPNRINVAEPTASEAVAILSAGIAVPPDAAGQFRLLSERLKRVPLLLELANRTLRTQIARPSTVEGALAWAFQRYRDLGVVAYDDQNPSEREDAIAKTVEVSLDFLQGDRRRCLELGMLHEDTDVPFVVLGTLWNLEETQVQDLVQRLQDFGLIKLNLRERWIHVHDYIRQYFARTLPDAALVHGRLADAWKDLGQLSSTYARRHIVYHLTESLRDPAQIVARAQQLVALLSNPRVEAYQRRHGDATALDTNLERAIARSAESGAMEVPGLIASLAVLRRQYASRARDAARVFEAAANGRLSDARQLLWLLDADERWNTVAQLVIAWLAPPDASADAQAIVDEVAPACREARLQRALSWVRQMPDGVPPGLPLIGHPPDLETVSAILQRAGGAEHVHGLEPLHMSGIASGNDQGGFIAERDAPALVAFANANPRTNSQYLERYIDVHATNRYVHYRNRSLWALLPPILTVRDAGWVRRMVQRIATAALTPASIDFEELLPLAVKGVLAAGGDAGGRAFLDDTRATVQQTAAQLDPKQGRADSWSHLHRRSGALAEIVSLALHDAKASAEHLAGAFNLPKGFAGFRAFSALSLAESARIVAPADRQAFDAALESATAAAHRIQDHQFCLQATSMVNAIKRRWATIDATGLAATIARFVKSPTASEFCAVHLVGERFAYRTEANEFQALPVPTEVLRASTLREVANAFERDPDNLKEVNGQIWSEADPLDEPLEENDEINIPDREFVPVLAARFAAEALVADGLTPDIRTQLIQKLTPAALSNPTALDAVLGRLLLSTIGRPTILPTTLQNLEIAPVKDAAGEAEGAYPS